VPRGGSVTSALNGWFCHAGVLQVLEQVPVDRALVAPLRLLRELAAHDDRVQAVIYAYETGLIAPGA
jgi:hypothetical protein